MIDEAAYLRVIRGESRGPGAMAARAALSAASSVYGLAVAARGAAFDRGWKVIERVGVPVVSVGNLTVGGTGKTPMVEWICRRLRARSIRVAILSRGYGATAGLNDEGRVLEENLPDVPHLQGADRARLARIAVEELESRALVLDDGFQHRRLGRDLDIVLLDALDPFGLGRLTPRGLLREPIHGLRRASVVVLSRADLVASEERGGIRARVERIAGRVPWVEARHAPRDLAGEGRDPESLTVLEGRRVAAFCGLGNPEGFRRTLEGMGAAVVDFRTFPDHHPYSAQDVSALARWARERGADLLLTTQKDSVKLRAEHLGGVPLRALRIGLEPLVGEPELVAALERATSTIEPD